MKSNTECSCVTLVKHKIRGELYTMECVVDKDTVMMNDFKKEVTSKKKKGVSKKEKATKPKRKAVEKKPRRRRPLKRTAMDKLQLRLVDYNKRLEINKGRLEILEKKVDTINHEISCRQDESSDNTVEENTVEDNIGEDNIGEDNVGDEQ